MSQVFKDELIARLSQLYQDDPFVNELFNSSGISLDNIGSLVDEVNDQIFFDKLTYWLLSEEKILGLNPTAGTSIEDRRSAVQAKWKGSGKSDIDLIQSVCNSWKNGEVEVSLIGKYLLIKNIHNVLTLEEMSNLKMASFEGDGSSIGAKILLKFVGENGAPKDLTTLLSLVNEIKPAHLPLEIRFRYLLIKEVHNVLTLAEIANKKMEEFA